MSHFSKTYDFWQNIFLRRKEIKIQKETGSRGTVLYTKLQGNFDKSRVSYEQGDEAATSWLLLSIGHYLSARSFTMIHFLIHWVRQQYKFLSWMNLLYGCEWSIVLQRNNSLLSVYPNSIASNPICVLEICITKGNIVLK